MFTSFSQVELPSQVKCLKSKFVLQTKLVYAVFYIHSLAVARFDW